MWVKTLANFVLGLLLGGIPQWIGLTKSQSSVTSTTQADDEEKDRLEKLIDNLKNECLRLREELNKQLRPKRKENAKSNKKLDNTEELDKYTTICKRLSRLVVENRKHVEEKNLLIRSVCLLKKEIISLRQQLAEEHKRLSRLTVENLKHLEEKNLLMHSVCLLKKEGISLRQQLAEEHKRKQQCYICRATVFFISMVYLINFCMNFN